jgi:trehalose 6-phosphate phosphatase
VSATHARYEDPVELARSIDALARPLLLVLDCDGVLAPLTDHADNSTLTPGVGADLTRLAGSDDLTVAVLSGRSLAGLSQFGFDDSIEVWGSYGAERRGHGHVDLTHEEAERLRSLDALLSQAAERAGDGAWIERKPTSVVVHVREADPRRGREALDWALQRQRELHGHTCHEGSNVLELMTRDADKGTALDALRTEVGAASCVYVGDDVPDEEAFARLGKDDLSVKVGDGDTVASRRLADPHAVRSMLGKILTAGTLH